MTSDIYKETILEHYRHPKNYGELPEANAEARESNVLCGDIIEMQVRIIADRIDDVRFRGEGCAISLASASMLTEISKGKTTAEIRKLGKKDVIQLLGTDPGPARIECAILPLKVLKMATYAHLGMKMPQEET
jgi:nitrogen fixation NifU-like protein